MCRLSFVRVLKSAVFAHSLPLLLSTPRRVKTICIDIMFGCISIVSFRLDHHWKLTNRKTLYFGCSNIKSYLSNSVFVSVFVCFMILCWQNSRMKNKTEKSKNESTLFFYGIVYMLPFSWTCVHQRWDEEKKTIKLGSKDTAANSISSTVQNYSEWRKENCVMNTCFFHRCCCSLTFVVDVFFLRLLSLFFILSYCF